MNHIGKRVVIADARNASLKGKRGTVVDETKNTLTLRGADGRELTIIKEQTTTITIEENHG